MTNTTEITDISCFCNEFWVEQSARTAKWNVTNVIPSHKGPPSRIQELKITAFWKEMDLYSFWNYQFKNLKKKIILHTKPEKLFIKLKFSDTSDFEYID